MKRIIFLLFLTTLISISYQDEVPISGNRFISVDSTSSQHSENDKKSGLRDITIDLADIGDKKTGSSKKAQPSNKDKLNDATAKTKKVSEKEIEDCPSYGKHKMYWYIPVPNDFGCKDNQYDKMTESCKKCATYSPHLEKCRNPNKTTSQYCEADKWVKIVFFILVIV